MDVADLTDVADIRASRMLGRAHVSDVTEVTDV